MYAVAVPRDAVSGLTDIPLDGIDDVRDIHYWRGHMSLHGWMERLYLSKGGTETDFNGAAVVLDDGDLDRLEAEVRRGAIHQPNGDVDDLAFISAAREAILAGFTVAYFGSR